MPPRLTDRDQLILAHFARYRITTTEMLRDLFYEEQTVEAAKSTLKRLREAKLVASDKLYPAGNETYHHLTPDGARFVSLPSDVAGPYSPDTLPRYLGRLLFCCRRDTPRPKFLDTEFDAAFPGFRVPGTEFAKRFYNDAYYLDEDHDQVRRLGLLLVELGANIARLVARTLTRAHELLPAFFAEGRFTLAIAAASDGRSDTIRRELESWRAHERIEIPIRIESYPALLPFFAGAGRG